jgi:hypothetical protein
LQPIEIACFKIKEFGKSIQIILLRHEVHAIDRSLYVTSTIVPLIPPATSVSRAGNRLSSGRQKPR